MVLSNNLQLVCPVRGQLTVNKKSKDGLTATEESYRVEAIRFLVNKGYPKENFWIEPIIKKFGNNGRNSFRSDFAVLDIPVDELANHSPEDILNHSILICEVKRDNAKSDYVKETQVKPMLDFAINQKTIGLYWDNIDRRVFWIEIENNIKDIKEGPISFIPNFGLNIQTIPLTFNTIAPSENLISTFSRIEDILHQASYAPEKRYEIILQLLLAKIFDEHQFEVRGDEPLEIQDFKSLGTTAEMAYKKMSNVVKRAVSFYSRHLPNKISDKLDLSGEHLSQVLQILAPIKITHSKRDVVQTFYMKFAKDLYKWDMAQYFTPTSVTDFIVDIANPIFGEHIADPACGSADFLVAAFRKLREYNPGYADCVWGIDSSPNAVQIAVLNMLLNGDGKTNIKHDDSLENVEKYLEHFDVITCNPPFGTRILEKRIDVLKKYELGFEWNLSESGDYVKTGKLLPMQESGILFIETCVKECKIGGRIALILPNGYLGNRSSKYRIVREWILKHTRVAAIISLPRFTFKSSGADVSASVIYLEKRETPIETMQELKEEAGYRFAVELIEKVGWEAGNKKAQPIYKRNQEDGSLIINEDGNPILDCDFEDAIKRIINSDASNCFDWLSVNRAKTDDIEGWTIGIDVVYNDPDLTLDPKRYCKKVMQLREALDNISHVSLGDIVDFIPEKENADGSKVRIKKSSLYNYVEIQDIGQGDYSYHEIRGWELPSRAKHFAEPGDIYFGSIWGSAVKWCYIPQNAERIVVTNGCFRCRMKESKKEYLSDLLAYMNSEGWGTQMRAFSRGSDGLAEICKEDASKVIIPLLPHDIKDEIASTIQSLNAGSISLNSIVKSLIKTERVEYNDPKKRPSHIVLV